MCLRLGLGRLASVSVSWVDMLALPGFSRAPPHPQHNYFHGFSARRFPDFRAATCGAPRVTMQGCLASLPTGIWPLIGCGEESGPAIGWPASDSRLPTGQIQPCIRWIHHAAAESWRTKTTAKYGNKN